MFVGFEMCVSEKGAEEVVFAVQAGEGLVGDLHGSSDTVCPAREAPVFVEVGMVAERGVGGVGFEVDGFDVDHVDGGPVGGDYEGSDVAAHSFEG